MYTVHYLSTWGLKITNIRNQLQYKHYYNLKWNLKALEHNKYLKIFIKICIYLKLSFKPPQMTD